MLLVMRPFLFFLINIIYEEPKENKRQLVLGNNIGSFLIRLVALTTFFIIILFYFYSLLWRLLMFDCALFVINICLCYYCCCYLICVFN